MKPNERMQTPPRPTPNPQNAPAPPAARVLGFDFGMKRIGAATGNRASGTSQALAGLAAKNGTPNWHEMEHLIAQWQPTTLVVGLPLHLDGGDSAMAARARQFGELVRRRFAVEVVFVDERLTTVAAETLLTQAHAATPGKALHRKRRKFRDSLAAELLVQTYLEKHRRV